MSDEQPPSIPVAIPYLQCLDLYSIMYGKKVLDIEPDDAYPGRSTIKFVDGTESKAWMTPPKKG